MKTLQKLKIQFPIDLFHDHMKIDFVSKGSLSSDRPSRSPAIILGDHSRQRSTQTAQVKKKKIAQTGSVIWSCKLAFLISITQCCSVNIGA